MTDNGILKEGKTANFLRVELYHVGTVSFKVLLWTVKYKGQIDTNGNAFGWGEAATEGKGIVMTGTFKDNQRHGLSKCSKLYIIS